MKLTESALRKIIKEELSNVIEAQTQYYPEIYTFTISQIIPKITQATISVYPYMETVRNKLKSFDFDPNVKVEVSSLKPKNYDIIVYAKDQQFQGRQVLIDGFPVNLHLADRLELFADIRK
jgi:hypothetical protein